MPDGNQVTGMVRKRGDDGQFIETVPKDGVLALFGEIDGPVIGPGDVAASFECSTDSARQKLQALEREGKLASREFSVTRVYWEVDGDG